MLKTATIGLCAGLALVTAPLAAQAQDAIAAPGQKTVGQTAKDAMIPSLAVINARGASLQGTTLTMTGVSPNAIVFADRPFRAAGHVLTQHFLKEWDEGSDSFAKDPPNATVSVLAADDRPAAVAARREPVDEERGRPRRLRQTPFEHRHLERQIVAFDLRRLQHHDGVLDSVALAAQDRDRGVRRVLGEAVASLVPLL